MCAHPGGHWFGRETRTCSFMMRPKCHGCCVTSRESLHLNTCKRYPFFLQSEIIPDLKYDRGRSTHAAISSPRLTGPRLFEKQQVKGGVVLHPHPTLRLSVVFIFRSPHRRPTQPLPHDNSGSVIFQAPAVPALGAAVAMITLAVSCPMVDAYTLTTPTSFLGSSVGGETDCLTDC